MSEICGIGGPKRGEAGREDAGMVELNVPRERPGHHTRALQPLFARAHQHGAAAATASGSAACAVVVRHRARAEVTARARRVVNVGSGLPRPRDLKTRLRGGLASNTSAYYSKISTLMSECSAAAALCIARFLLTDFFSSDNTNTRPTP